MVAFHTQGCVAKLGAVEVHSALGGFAQAAGGLLWVTHPRLVRIALSLQWVRRYLTATGLGIGSRDSGRLEEG